MNFETISITAIVGILTYTIGVFFKPLLLIARDSVMWWIIEKNITNDEIFSLIESYADEKQQNNCMLTILAVSTEQDGKVTYKFPVNLKYWHPINISTESFQKIHAKYKSEEKRLQAVEIRINRKAMAYDLLIKHNSLDNDEFNPIRKKLSDEIAMNDIGDQGLYEKIESILGEYQQVNRDTWKTNRMRQRAHDDVNDEFKQMELKVSKEVAKDFEDELS